MAISDRDRKLLWARSGNRCAFPGCECEITQDKEDGTGAFPLAPEAHIVGRKPNSPRGDHPLPLDQRDSYDNFILLCPTHHTVIDNDVDTYTVEKLHQMKGEHEGWVSENLAPPTPADISLAKLPTTDPHLFGREEQLKILDQAWEDRHTHVVALTAPGGVGKSAIVNHWLREMEKDDYRGARRVFGWSFYSQGTSERTVSADQFIHSALTFFGDPDPNQGSPWDKGQRLAQLIRQQPTLLILDGLEPLQWGPGPQEGEFKDRAGSMYPLLRELSHGMDGLCALSSRVNVSDLPLSDTSGPARRVDLERLLTEAGRALLSHYGIKGPDSDLDATVEEYEGHALALCLLAEYLVGFLDGDIAKRDLVPALQQETRQGRHAFRVMDAYDIALKRDGREPERAILRIIGLFDRPASKRCLGALRREPAIEGVSDSLVGLSDRDWRHAIGRLRKWRLLKQPRGEDDGSLDSHPLVREYFGPKLEQESPEGFRQAHSRLYAHLRDTAKELPDTLEEMEPLLEAVHHSHMGGRALEALSGVYRVRMQRGDQAHCAFRLGALASSLAALSTFFEQKWTRPLGALEELPTGFLLNEASLLLIALGRLREALPPGRLALALAQRIGRADNAAKAAGHLALLLRQLGELDSALGQAVAAITLADDSLAIVTHWGNRCERGAVLHKQGCLSASRDAFLAAEERQQQHAYQPRTLYSCGGAEFCDLLVDLGRADEASKRAQVVTDAGFHDRVPRDIGLGCLRASQGAWAALHAPASRPSHATCQTLQRSFDEAVQYLRRAGHQSHLCDGLVARSSCHRDFGEREQAQHDVDEALELSTRIGLRLHETDACILQGHMAVDGDSPDIEGARKALDRAQELVEKTGYELRRADLLILEGRLLAKRGEGDAGRAKLEEAIKVAHREEDEGCIYQVAVDQANRYLEELEAQ